MAFGLIIFDQSSLPKGITCSYCQSSERALTLCGRGFRFISVGSDVSFLRSGLAAAAATLKG